MSKSKEKPEEEAFTLQDIQDDFFAFKVLLDVEFLFLFLKLSLPPPKEPPNKRSRKRPGP